MSHNYSETRMEDQRINFEGAIEKIQGIADGNSIFKIGKTGQKLEDRFSGEYESDYDKIIPICKSSNANTIDIWEKGLINHFQNDDDYKDKCDNIAVGGGNMDVESGTYRIYVVVKA